MVTLSHSLLVALMYYGLLVALKVSWSSGGSHVSWSSGGSHGLLVFSLPLMVRLIVNNIFQYRLHIY